MVVMFNLTHLLPLYIASVDLPENEGIPKARNVELEPILGSSEMSGAKELVSGEREGGIEETPKSWRTRRHHSSVKEGPSGQGEEYFFQ